MKKTYAFTVVAHCLLAYLGAAQEVSQNPARIVGKLSNGSPSATPTSAEMPVFDVRHQVTTRKTGHSVTMCRVEKPNQVHKPLSNIAEAIDRETPECTLYDHGKQKAPLNYAVSATVVDRRATLVEWWSFNGDATKKLRAISNINWTLLQGFVSFEARGEQFTFMHFPSSVDTRELHRLKRNGHEVVIPQIPEYLPSIINGARYVMLEGDESDDNAMEFMEAIHELYDVEKRRLVKAHRMRNINRRIRARQLRRNPPPKENVTVYYWKEPRLENTSSK